MVSRELHMRELDAFVLRQAEKSTRKHVFFRKEQCKNGRGYVAMWQCGTLSHEIFLRAILIYRFVTLGEFRWHYHSSNPKFNFIVRWVCLKIRYPSLVRVNDLYENDHLAVYMVFRHTCIKKAMWTRASTGTHPTSERSKWQLAAE